MVTKALAWSVLVYGALLILLGFLGYTKAGSLISLYMGAGSGSLLVLSSFLIFGRVKFGSYAATLLTLALTATFGIRYSLTHAEIPAIMAVLSGGMLLFLLAKTIRWKQP